MPPDIPGPPVLAGNSREDEFYELERGEKKNEADGGTAREGSRPQMNPHRLPRATAAAACSSKPRSSRAMTADHPLTRRPLAICSGSARVEPGDSVRPRAPYKDHEGRKDVAYLASVQRFPVTVQAPECHRAVESRHSQHVAGDQGMEWNGMEWKALVSEDKTW
jgi:hypothetical protein